MLVHQGLKSKFTRGPNNGIKVKLVGTQYLNVSGDKARFEVDVGTNMGRISSEREFWNLDNDEEHMVMGVQWNNDLVGIIVRIVNIDTFGQVFANPPEYVEDEAVEENIFQENNIERKIGELGEIFFILLFRTSIPSETSCKDMGKCFSNHSTKRGVQGRSVGFICVP